MEYTFYRIYSKNPAITECYIGSTEDLYQRKSTHKANCNNINNPYYNIKIYQYIRSNGGFESFEFEVIDTITFSKTDRLFHERRLIKLYGATLNTVVRPIITEEDKNEYKKEYYETHKEKIDEYQKEYQKEYRETHKEYYKEHSKEYYETHKEELHNKKNTKMVCDVCGVEHSYGNKSRHLKSKKHQDYIINKTI
jgi:hypothetical protein